MGDIEATGRWPPYQKAQKILSVSCALEREKIIRRFRGVPASLSASWDATIEDVGLLLRPILLAGSSIFGSIGAEDCIQPKDLRPPRRTKFVAATVPLYQLDQPDH